LNPQPSEPQSDALPIELLPPQIEHYKPNPFTRKLVRQNSSFEVHLRDCRSFGAICRNRAQIVPKAFIKPHCHSVLLRVESAGSVGEVGSVNDVVALENSPRLVPADPHGHALLNAKPAKVADAAPSQIVKQQTRNASIGANLVPDFSESIHRFAFHQGAVFPSLVRSREHEVIRLLADDASGQQCCDFARHHDHAAFAVLCRSRFQPNRAVRQVEFTSLRKIAKQDAQETVDYSAYEEQIRRLVDKHVVGREVKEGDGVILVNELGKTEDPRKWSEEKTRNETDIIRSRLKKTIQQELADDPYAQAVLSELLKQAIAEAEAMFNHPYKQYMLLKDFEQKVSNRDIESVPDAFGDSNHAKAYYGTFRLVLGDGYFEKIGKQDGQAYIDEAFAIEKTVRKAVAEHSVNPQDIETEIRRALLPRLFNLIGLDRAKEVIERVIQITRVGLSRGTA
jgi:hypothetical protein